MRAKSEATNLLVQDIQDQPPSKYILLVGGILGNQGAIGVDKAVSNANGVMAFYRRTAEGEIVYEKEVAVIPTHLQWSMVERPLLQMVKLESLLAKAAEDKKVVEEIEQRYFPAEKGKDEESPSPTLVRIDGDKEEVYGNYL